MNPLFNLYFELGSALCYLPVTILGIVLLVINFRSRFRNNVKSRKGNPSIVPLVFFASISTQSFFRTYFFVLSFGYAYNQSGLLPVNNCPPINQGINEFFNDFPAAMWLSTVTILLLQWASAFSPSIRTYGKLERINIFYLVANIVVYLVMLSLFGVLQFSTKEKHLYFVKIVLTCIYTIVLGILLIGMMYFAFRAYYIFKDTSMQRMGNNILWMFLFFSLCCLARIGFMIEAMVSDRDSTFNVGGNTDGWIVFLYYSIGEAIPSIILIVIQHYMCIEDLNSELSTLWEPIPVMIQKQKAYIQ